MADEKKELKFPEKKEEKKINVKNITFLDISKNPDAFDFRCKTVMIKPKVEIYFAGTDKLITVLTNLDVVGHNGTMNQEYADKFFEDMATQSKPAFIQQVLQKAAVKPQVGNQPLKKG